MNQGQRFCEGDRISTKYPIAGLPAGSCRTVQLVFHTLNGIHDVLFEPSQTRRVVFQPELILTPPAWQVAQRYDAF